MDWARLEEVFGGLYCADNGAPAESTRLMVALHYLKFSYDLSDEDVVAGWVENPYWQYLSGMKYFEHRRPIDPSTMLMCWSARVLAMLDPPRTDWAKLRSTASFVRSNSRMHRPGQNRLLAAGFAEKDAFGRGPRA